MYQDQLTELFERLREERKEVKQDLTVWRKLSEHAECLGYTSDCARGLTAVIYTLKYIGETIITWSSSSKEVAVHANVHAVGEYCLSMQNDIFFTTFSCKLNLITDYDRIMEMMMNLCDDVKKLKKQKLIADILVEGN